MKPSAYVADILSDTWLKNKTLFKKKPHLSRKVFVRTWEYLSETHGFPLHLFSIYSYYAWLFEKPINILSV